MPALIVSVPGSEDHASRLSAQLDIPIAALEHRRFPDGEFYCRFHTDLAGKDVLLVSTLHQPSDKFLLVSFLASTARDLGAKRVGLVAPYLSFMRQDIQFHPGEGVTSVYFARLLSQSVDWLVTVDPHLHRHAALSPMYTIPTAIAPAAPAMAAWVTANVSDPLLVGPDAESHQWVNAVAHKVAAPAIILEKTRRGDRDVSVSEPNVHWNGQTPVIIDDIISTGRTMIEAVKQVVAQGAKPPVCIGIHAVFSDDADVALCAAGASQVVSCNTITHHSNAIDVTATLAQHVIQMLRS
jgi:ribose-phosphate pyrophosphokinase